VLDEEQIKEYEDWVSVPLYDDLGLDVALKIVIADLRERQKVCSDIQERCANLELENKKLKRALRDTYLNWDSGLSDETEKILNDVFVEHDFQG